LGKDKLRVLTLDYVTEQIDRLPLLPSVTWELSELSHDADNFYEKVTELAEQDPPLTAKILKFANSASSSPVSQIHNVHHALVRLGVLNTLDLITALAVEKAFKPSKAEHKGIWRHSIETAIFSRFLVDHMPGFHVSGSLAYTCGLLHDIGRFVLLQISFKIIDLVDMKGWSTPEELPDVERELFGFSHAEVGYIAAERWQLPKAVCNTLRFHHHYNLWNLEEASQSFLQLLTVIQFADFLSVLLIKNPDWSDWSKEELKVQISEYCIHSDWPGIQFPIDALIQELPELASKCERILSCAGID